MVIVMVRKVLLQFIPDGNDGINDQDYNHTTYLQDTSHMQSFLVQLRNIQGHMHGMYCFLLDTHALQGISLQCQCNAHLEHLHSLQMCSRNLQETTNQT